MEGWKAVQSSGPDNQPGMVCNTLSAGALDSDPKKEWFQAMVIAPPADDPTDEDQRLEKGLTRLISLLQEKLSALQSGNES